MKLLRSILGILSVLLLSLDCVVPMSSKRFNNSILSLKLTP